MTATSPRNCTRRVLVFMVMAAAVTEPVGMVALTGRWWLEVRKPRRETVAAHLVNIAWNGLSHLEPKPTLTTRRAR